VPQDRPRRDPLERRTIWVLALAVIAFVIPSGGLALYGGQEWWNVVLWIVGNAFLLFAIGAAGLALAPASAVLPGALGERRPELLTVAILLLWLGLALILADFSLLAVDAIGESGF
jgi:hypothetical protein